jgi:dTDP-4-amino-4,6-dideoxygalactose transaminase
MSWVVPYFDLQLGQEEKQAAVSVIESNWLTSGPRIQDFETEFARAFATPELRAVAVSSCTAALHIAVASLGIGEGDEVVVPSLSFVASANAVRYCGATPVFADIESADRWNIDPADVEAKISSRTKAIMVMHYGGHPCDMGRFQAVAIKHKLPIIEDACHGPLVEYQGRKLGTIGEIGCFSFFSNKNMTTGEGGMLVTKSAAIAERAKILRSHGMTSSSYERFKGHAFGYDVTELGYNYRLDEMRAAIGLVQLKKIRAHNAARRKCIQYYRAAVARKLDGIDMPFSDSSQPEGDHIFPVLLPMEARREDVMAKLAEKGVQTSFHYRPIHTFTAYRDVGAKLPRIDAIAPRILSLPLFPTLTESQIDHVVSSLGQAI